MSQTITDATIRHYASLMKSIGDRDGDTGWLEVSRLLTDLLREREAARYDPHMANMVTTLAIHLAGRYTLNEGWCGAVPDENDIRYAVQVTQKILTEIRRVNEPGGTV